MTVILNVAGHGLVDWVVVLGVVVYTCYALATNPKLLLLWLPTIVSIYFFIPLGSMLTPERIVPMLIAGWMVFNRKFSNSSKLNGFTGLGIFVVWISVGVGFFIGDAGIRPIFRGLYYTGLIVNFLFVTDQVRSREDLRRLMLGFAIVGIVHVSYSLYQMIAFRLGLPFRGIARGEIGQIATLADGFRINGLASEPKRLGFVLFAGAIGMLAIGSGGSASLRRTLWMGGAALTLIVSSLTYSTSYYLALLVIVMIFVLFLPQYWAKTIPGILSLIAIAALIPAMRNSVIRNANQMLEFRLKEYEEGLDGRKVYRQEFFAENFLKKEPLTAVTGVGMGRYNFVFRDQYGDGAGMVNDTGLKPLNSQFLECLFDLGIIGLIMVYGAGGYLVLKLWERPSQQTIWFIALVLFMLIQSVFVQSLSLLAISSGGAIAYLTLNHRKALRRRRSGAVRRSRKNLKAFDT